MWTIGAYLVVIVIPAALALVSVVLYLQEKR